MDEVLYLGQLLLSLVLGGTLGWQRERVGKPAGVRTYALVTAGAALFTILSVHAFGSSDPSRVAAQVIVGIGFIGAGSIIQREDHVEGLTTAAGLWMAAAIGMAIGTEKYLVGIGGALLILIVLMIDDGRFRKKLPEPVAEVIKTPKQNRS